MLLKLFVTQLGAKCKPPFIVLKGGDKKWPRRLVSPSQKGRLIGHSLGGGKVVSPPLVLRAGITATTSKKMDRSNGSLKGGTVMTVMIKKNVVRLWLENVPQDKVFLCHDGRVVRNMDELVAALRDMSEETFRYHATGEKNDFGAWVGDVVGDVTLANQLKKAADSATSARKAELRLAWLKQRL